MAEKKYFINDNVVISDEIRKMPPEEIEAQLQKAYAEAAKEKARIEASCKGSEKRF